MRYFRSSVYSIIFLFLVTSSLLLSKEQLPEIKKLPDGRFSFDGVTLDKENRMIEFPMIANQNHGLIEYAIVHQDGKIHESLFRTLIRPQVLHASLLLLKAKTAGEFFDDNHDENKSMESFSKHCLQVKVRWEQNGSANEVDMREFYYNHNNRQKRPKNKIYLITGSRFIENTFMAEQSGSILGVYLDRDAIINSIETDSNNDDLWLADKSKMPPLESFVSCLLVLPN